MISVCKIFTSIYKENVDENNLSKGLFTKAKHYGPVYLQIKSGILNWLYCVYLNITSAFRQLLYQYEY